MKKVKLLISALILSAVVFSATAQREQNALRQFEERNTYSDNWFISLGGSANLLHAEQDKYLPLKKKVEFGGAVSVGKWFGQNFGARIQGNYGTLKGYNRFDHYSQGYYTPGHKEVPYADQQKTSQVNTIDKSLYKTVTDKHGVVGFYQKFDYTTVSVDLMGNLTNLLRGRYVEGHWLDVIPFAGIGWVHSFDNKTTNPSYNHFVGRLGLRFNFNVSKNIAIYLEPQLNVTEKEFDGYSGTALGDGFSNLGLGLQYTINKRFDSMSQFFKLTADEIDRLNSKINANRYLIDNHQDILERQQNLLDRLEKCCEEGKTKEVLTQVIEKTHFPDYIRFGLDSYKIEDSELRKIAEMADYLKRNPNSRVLLIGYADRKTGNPRYNLGLSQKRVNVVQAEFKRLGISENRIIIDWKGDKEQPFPQNEWNRVVIVTER